MMSPLIGAVAWRVGLLLLIGAGLILLIDVRAGRRTSVAAPLAERQARARGSLWQRFRVWVVGIVVLFAGAASGPVGFALLLALLSMQAVREVAAALRARRIAVPVWLVAIAAPLIVLSGLVVHGRVMVVGAVAPVLCGPIVVSLARRGAASRPSVVVATMAALGYVAAPLSVLAATLERPDGLALVCWLLIVIVLSDTCAMFGGLAFGRRPIATRISPGKTLEGLIAGLVGAVAGATVMRFAFPASSLAVSAVAALGVGVAGIVGDLLASALKRAADVKDFSRFLPGHGGLMDRLDSVLIGVPALALLIWLGLLR